MQKRTQGVYIYLANKTDSYIWTVCQINNQYAYTALEISWVLLAIS